jgi:hypothetical protein
MDRLSKMDREELIRRMREDFERTMLQVADAVNAAPDGHLIDGSEEQVRDLLGDFRRRAFETAAQLRVEATEGSAAFSRKDQRVRHGVAVRRCSVQRPGGGASPSVRNRRGSDRSAGG